MRPSTSPDGETNLSGQRLQVCRQGSIRELHSERDLIVHGLWLPKDVQSYLDYVSDVDPTEYYTVRPRRWRDHYHGQILTDETINELANKLQNLSAVLRKWRDDYLPYIEANTDADVND